jgi:hypothetical protein
MPDHVVISRSVIISVRQLSLPGRTSIPVGLMPAEQMRVAQGQVSSEEVLAPLLEKIKAAV